VHLSFRDGGAEVYGVSSHHVVKELYGRGRVFGVAFQPGAFRPFLGRSVSSITDRSVLAADIFGWLPENADVAAVEGVLRANLPEPDRNAEFAQLAVERIIDDPAVTRVDALASGLGTSVRSLQRLFAKHVGVGPKWVIRRYRLHEVTERMASGAQIAWAALAADLGYADQAHFVRDFRAMVGESPAQYWQRY
jgi:AraC-like DNA-binding protein